MEPEKGQKNTRKSEEGVRKRLNKGEEAQASVSSAEDYTVTSQEQILPQTQQFPGSLKIAREGPPRRVGRPCKPKVPLLGQLHISKSQPASPAFMAPHVNTEHGHEGQVWQVVDPIQSGPSRSFASSASHARLSRPAEDPTQKTYVQRPTQVSVKQADEPPKKEKKPQKPGKYICQYCSRPCAKPSVLQKHIRSHTGERPYPCVPCGFSFKTKSNLYKHRKSHAHRIKAGLASEISVETYPSNLEMERLGGEEIDDPSEGESTDSEDETSTMSNLVELSPQQKHQSATCDTKNVSRHQGIAHDLFSLSQQHISQTSEESVTFTEPTSELIPKSEDTHSIKQKLALRLSERKKASEEQTFLSPGSKGSTESGYFSRSESAEQQISPPNTNAKSYAEIILGKCGRIGQRTSMLASPPILGAAEEKTTIASMSVPRTQVIEHITKLITINEAVVDTSEIDSVKPRRSSLSRRSSIESPKGTLFRESFQFDVKSPGSISQLDTKSLSERAKAEHSFSSLQQSHSATDTVPLLRSHSMPSSASTASSPHQFRSSYSFDDRIVDSEAMSHSHMFSSHPRLLKRQPAIELPLGMDYSLEEGSVTGKDTAVKTPEDMEGKETEVTKKSKKGGRVKGLTYECNICGARYKKRGNYETHKKYYCSELQILKAPSLSSPSSVEIRKEVSEHETWPQMLSYKLGPSIELSTLRKRRKEKSLGDDEEPQMADWSEYPTSATALDSHFATSTTSLTLCTDAPKFGGRSESTALSDVESKEKTTISKEISVIQHTSSFEKSESIEKKSGLDEEDLRLAQMSARPHAQSSHPLQPKLVRQHNIQVPEILVTEEPDKPEADIEDPPKELEKVEEFQWPQRSQTLAQLPAEKLPPKKKRLRLAEMAQSSGDSSFESMSLTPSPSQDSSISHASSHSVSFDREEGSKSEVLGLSSDGTTKALGHHMLTVPSHHHHVREMRRSASEQTPNISHTPQVSENRSKSFDYGNLTSLTSSSMPTAQERRKCFSLRQTSLSRHVELEPEVLPHDWKESDKPSTSSQSLGTASQEQSSRVSPKEQQSSPFQPKQNRRTVPSLTEEMEKSYVSKQLSIFPIQPLLHLPQHASELLPSQVMSNISTPFSLQPITHSIFPAPPVPLPPSLLHPDHVQIPQHVTSHVLDSPVRPHAPFLPMPYSASSSLPHAFFMPIQPQLALPVSAQVGCHYPQIKPEISPTLAISNLSPSKDYFAESLRPQSHSPLALESSPQVTLSHSEPVVSLVVPVRIQTHMPSYGNAMYTTLSQMLVTPPPCSPSSLVIQKINDGRSKSYHSFDLARILPKDESIVSEIPYLRVPFPKTDPSSYLPLTSSVESVLGYDGSSSSVGGSKRMLSPAGSLELTMETQQQKRVKEEDDPEERVQNPLLKAQSRLDQSRSTKIAVLISTPQNRSELLTPSPLAVLEPLTVLERHKIHLSSMAEGESHLQKEDIKDDSIKVKEEKDDKGLLVPALSSTPPSHTTGSHEEAEAKNVPTFPTLHTTTNVSWCYLNYVKPNHIQQNDRRASVYSNWCISVYNPNLPGVSTRVALSLLRSRQKISSEIYTIANAPQPDSSVATSRTQKPKMTEVRSAYFTFNLFLIE